MFNTLIRRAPWCEVSDLDETHYSRRKLVLCLVIASKTFELWLL
jgi:ubiquinone biosynthesis protein COQ9